MRSAYANREFLEVNKSVPGRMFSEMAIATLSKSANLADTEQAHSSQKDADFTGGIKWFPLISGSSSKQSLLRKCTGVRLFLVSYLSGHRVKLWHKDGSVATMLLWVSLLVVLLAVILFIRQKDPPPIFGVYQQPGKWYPLKCVIFFAILKLRRVSYRKCLFQQAQFLPTTSHAGTEGETYR